MDRDSNYKAHILDSIAEIEKYTAGMTEQDFDEYSMAQSAVIRQLEVIGEASKRLSDDFKQKYPALPWKEIAGFRDKVIHHYTEVDMVVIWSIIKKDLPLLKAELLKK